MKLKKVCFIMLVLMMSACGNTQSAKETSATKHPTEEIQASHNILVTYFSRVGNTEFPSDVEQEVTTWLHELALLQEEK